jgi:transcription factor E2F3
MCIPLVELNILTEFISYQYLLYSQFDEGIEDLGGGATPPMHTNMPKHRSCEDLHTTNDAQSSKSMYVEHNVQYSQNTPQDPSPSNDFGGMTRIIPSDVNVSQVSSILFLQISPASYS